jgi:ferritin-like metal-binding protein YciE
MNPMPNRYANNDPMKLNTLEDLYVHELKDLFSAEQQIIKALPKMAKAASSKELASGFQEHLEQTKGHAQRLEEIRLAESKLPVDRNAREWKVLLLKGRK